MQRILVGHTQVQISYSLTLTFLLAFPAQLDLDYSYSELSDIVQLDGPADNSDAEEEGGAPLDENDFLGIINAEAIKALQEGGGSSDGNSISSSSDSEGADKLSAEDEVSDKSFWCSICYCMLNFVALLRNGSLQATSIFFFITALIWLHINLHTFCSRGSLELRRWRDWAGHPGSLWHRQRNRLPVRQSKNHLTPPPPPPPGKAERWIPTVYVVKCVFLSQIHRSKNRWKFHLKDGVMCYAGRDYVFSKAVGEAEW